MLRRDWLLHSGHAYPADIPMRPSVTTTRADLVQRCRAGKADGMDFPTLWHEVLKVHPLVIGPPVQTVREGRIRMEIRLITGGSIAFDTDTHELLPD